MRIGKKILIINFFGRETIAEKKRELTNFSERKKKHWNQFVSPPFVISGL